MNTDPKSILVLCTSNRCRSQMAEGWLKHFGQEKVYVKSAGTQPKGVHAMAKQVMREAGVDISAQASHHVDRYKNQHFDLVVTVCDNAKEACPLFPNARKVIHHCFQDPDSKYDLDKAVFERVRDEIRDWAKQVIEQLVG